VSLNNLHDRAAIRLVGDVARKFNSPIAVLILADGHVVRTVSWGETEALRRFAKKFVAVTHQAALDWDGGPPEDSNPTQPS
jgi:hypothetical protein